MSNQRGTVEIWRETDSKDENYGDGENKGAASKHLESEPCTDFSEGNISTSGIVN